MAAPLIIKTVTVAVPSITDPDIAKVDVSLSVLDWTPTRGDVVIACPEEALPTNCRQQGAYVSADDTVTIVYGSEGGNVTGANKTYTFFFYDLT